MFGRYTGLRPLAVAWTLLAVAVGLVVLPGPVPAVTGVAYEPWLPGRSAVRVGSVAGGWIGGLGFLWLRERRHWRRLADRSRFVPQGETGSTYPPLQASVGGRTVTAEARSAGRLRRVHTLVRTSVDGLASPVRIRVRVVGEGGRGEGRSLSNPALDDRLVVDGPSADRFEGLLDPDRQSALLDLATPGEIRLTERSVVYEVPSTRLSPVELGTVATAVAGLADCLEDGG